MQLDEIFRKRRKTEANAIFMCRNLIMLMIIALLIGYTVFLVLNVCKDVPILKTESRTESSLRPPKVKLEFDHKFSIACSFGFNSKLTEHTLCSFCIGRRMTNFINH
jgi:hypothetical protein